LPHNSHKRFYIQLLGGSISRDGIYPFYVFFKVLEME